MGLTQAEVARAVGVSRQSIAKRVKRGQIAVLRDGTIGPKAVAALRAEIDPARVAAGRRGVPRPAEPEPDAAPRKPVEPEPDAAPPKPPSPHERKVTAEAELKELAMARLRGQVIDVGEAARAARAFARRVHDAVLGIPDGAARALDGRVLCRCGEPVDAKHLALEIERHLRDVLDVLSADPLGEMKGS